MQIKEISIENYKCFYDAQSIKITSGFNLFIGKNNSGKTTALEILSAKAPMQNQHRSPLSMDKFGDSNKVKSSHSISIELSLNELINLSNGKLLLPLPETSTKGRNISAEADNIRAEIDNRSIILTFKFSDEGIRLASNTALGTTDFLLNNEGSIAIQIKEDIKTKTFTAHAGNFTSTAHSIISNISSILGKIYKFSALRTPKSRHDFSGSIELYPDARNLAYCINYLQTNDAEGHKQLCSLINRVFPEVAWVQATPELSSKNFELNCLPLTPEHRRDDLGISLDQMGTGIGNVISILYVALTSRHPQLIAIDEPNSFLHPKALRELLQILESHGKQHQYILTGHSPDVLTAIEPSTITYFEMEGPSSKIKQFNKNQYHEFRSELSDLGIRMTDLHAKDRVLWVEGQTEEIVFPKLLREYCPEISAGTAVLRVTHTGTFETGKVHINEVANTYIRLTQTSLAPPMVAIVLDTEGRKQQDIEKITRENNKLIHFLPYRMIENYVLDADAILAVLKTYQIDANLAAVVAQLPSNENIQNADGAKILKEIFTTSSDATYEFRKTTHTPELFDWLLENKKDNLKPLELFIQSICATTL